jgi:glycosyltransferase involved in cell wall biosynthesis
MARVEHALAIAAQRRPNTVLACYDAHLNQFRALNPDWRDIVLGWSGAMDTHQPQPAAPGIRGLLPRRQPLVAALERRRLTSRSPHVAQLAGLAQRALLAVRPHQFPLWDDSGLRIANVPRDLALGHDLRPCRGDTVLAGHGWFDREPATIGALARRHGFRYATLCYDLIPITHPQFFQPEIAGAFRAYWQGIVPFAGPIIVNAACIGRDLKDFWEASHGSIPDVRQCPLGYDPPPQPNPDAILPAGLRQGKFALFVSTIEPRKGHAMLLRVWRHLLARGIPQRGDFRLVFVGRPGWMVEDVLSELLQPKLRRSVLHLPNIGQEILDTLYDQAAFCLYPSAYEGFGLPVIEAFARDKAVLTSTGGALPETVGGLSPCLDPTDDSAWEAAIARWIEHPEAILPVQGAIRLGFAHPTWGQAAAGILDAAAT